MEFSDVITSTRFQVSQLQFPVLTEPPSWTRLEPQSVTGDPRPGIEARIHDPLWLLARQWQFGEFAGEDAGSPVGVRVAAASAPITRWQPGAADVDTPAPARPFGASMVLDALVEREAGTDSVPSLRARADAALVLLAALDDAELPDVEPQLLVRCPFAPAASPPNDPAWRTLAALIVGRVPDAHTVAGAIEDAAGVPPWLMTASAAERAMVASILDEWLAWYRREIAPLPNDAPDSWVGPRLEYRFSVAATLGDDEVVLRAPAYGGGAVDWHTFDVAPGATLDAEVIAPQRQTQAVVATPLRFPGMPADRLWAFEDGAVNLGGLETEPYDLAKLLLVEFAMTYGSDWLVVPLDVPQGSLTTIDSLTYTTTFGERFRVDRTDVARAQDPWRMFTITDDDAAGFHGLFVPPTAVQTLEGPALEEVVFLRDEMANVAWGIERMVSTPSGATRERANEPKPFSSRAPHEPVPTAALEYILQTNVPAHWIPYVPRSNGSRSIDLVRGAIHTFSGAVTELVRPIGRLLGEAGHARLIDAEVPREGIRVRRVPMVARAIDGSYVRWIARRVFVGRGEGSSGLAFDEARPRKPSTVTDGAFLPAPDEEPTTDPRFDPVPDPPVVAALDFSRVPDLSPAEGVNPHVKLLQAMLNGITASPPLPIDGQFGAATSAAVIAFQTSIGLPASGVVDAHTWMMLAVTNPFPQLEPGVGLPVMAGPTIGAVQTLLNLAGASPRVPQTSRYDAATTAAVRTFQAQRGLAPSGIVDAATWPELADVSEAAAPTGAIRLTFSYDAALWGPGVDPVQLTASEPIEAIAPRSDDLGPRGDVNGFWIEIQDAHGHALYRRDVHRPIALITDVQGDGEPGVVPNPPTAGAFELVIPDVPEAATVVLFSSPLDLGRLDEPAAAIATFTL